MHTCAVGAQPRKTLEKERETSARQPRLLLIVRKRTTLLHVVRFRPVGRVGMWACLGERHDVAVLRQVLSREDSAIFQGKNRVIYL